MYGHSEQLLFVTFFKLKSSRKWKKSSGDECVVLLREECPQGEGHFRSKKQTNFAPWGKAGHIKSMKSGAVAAGTVSWGIDERVWLGELPSKFPMPAVEESTAFGAHACDDEGAGGSLGAKKSDAVTHLALNFFTNLPADSRGLRAAASCRAVIRSNGLFGRCLREVLDDDELEDDDEEDDDDDDEDEEDDADDETVASRGGCPV
jgi:hypothetical protein